MKSVLGEASIVERGSNPDAVSLNLNGSQSYVHLSAAGEIKLKTAMAGEANQRSEANTASQHTDKTKKVLVNAALTGKISADALKIFLGMPADKDSVDAIYGIIKATPINTTGDLDGKVHPALIKEAGRSYKDIYKNVRGGFSNLKRGAPELYRAKVFEGTGELPEII